MSFLHLSFNVICNSRSPFSSFFDNAFQKVTIKSIDKKRLIVLMLSFHFYIFAIVIVND